GAVVVTLLPELLRASEGFYLIIFSLAVILMMLFMPKGLVEIWDWMVRKMTGRGLDQAHPPAPPEPAAVLEPK
ncbi:MAG: hypothetical protein HYU32_09260, partial [candidate division NC10 bacterium]|nr:hypothetical protein [candidate division NC10 bacterium]